MNVGSFVLDQNTHNTSRPMGLPIPQRQQRGVLAYAVVVSVEAVKFVERFTVVLVALLAFVGVNGMDGRAERIVGVYLFHLARL